MEMLYLMLFFIALLAVSFIRLLITNSAVYAVKVRKFTDKKRFILKASVMLNFCVVVDLSEKPIIYFSSDLIKAMAQLSAEIEFDMYIG